MTGLKNASKVDKKEDLVQVHGRIPYDLYLEFQQMAYEKHPFDHCGAIRKEIEKAIRAAVTAAHTHKNGNLVPSRAEIPEKSSPPQKPSRVERKYAEVMEYLKSAYGLTLAVNDPEKAQAALVPYAWFKAAVNEMCGTDDRTFKAWWDAFELSHFIAEARGGVFGDGGDRIKMAAAGHCLTEDDHRQLAQVVYEHPKGGLGK